MRELIDSIEQRLNGNLEAGLPILKGTPLDSKQYLKHLDGILDPTSTAFNNLSIARHEDTLSVTGTADAWGHTAIDVALSFQTSMDLMGCTLQLSLPELPGPEWLRSHITNPVCTLQLGPFPTNDEDAVYLPAAMRVGFAASLNLEGMAIPIHIMPGVPGRSGWSLALTGSRVSLKSIAGLASWLGADHLMDQIPADLLSLGGWYISDFALSLAEDDRTIEEASVVIRSDEQWPLLKDRIELSDITVALNMYTEPETEKRRSTVMLFAGLQLGTQALRVRLQAFGGTRLLLELTPNGRFTLPSFGDLERLVGDGHISKALPPELAELNLLDLTGFSIEFDLSRAAINRVTAGLRTHLPVQIGEAVDLQQTEIGLAFQPGTETPLRAWINGQLLMNGLHVPVSGKLEGDLQVQGSIDTMDVVGLLTTLFPDVPPPLKNAGLTFSGIHLFASTGGQLQLSASLDADFRSLAAALAIPLPESLATIRLDRVAATLDTQANTWSFALTTPLELRLPASGDHYLGVSGISIEVGRTTEGPATSCRFTLIGGARLSDDVSFSTKNVVCQWTSGKNAKWSCDGDMDVLIHGSRHAFGAYIEKTAESVRFGMRYAGSVPVSPWPRSVAVDLRSLEIGLEKESTDKSYRWALKGASHFDIAKGFLVADGSVELSGGVLLLKAEVSQAPTITLEGLPKSPSIDIDIEPLQLKLGGDQHTIIEAGASLTLSGIPAPADVIFPDGTTKGAFRLDDQGYRFSFEPLADPSLAISFMGIDLTKITVGEFVLKQYTASGSKKKSWRMGAKMSIDSLSQLNRLFGGYDLFEDRVDLMCTLGGGFAMNLAGPSPLKPVKLRAPKKDGTVWTEWVDLPDTGAFSFRVPEFAFNFAGGRWRASGGMESKETLTLPMGILKRTLDGAKIPNPFAFLPDRIPLTELDLKNDALYAVFENLFGNLDKKTAAVLNKLSEILRDGLDRVPANMDEYLKINIPESFTFDLSIEPTGGYAIGLNVEGKPMRVLLPWMTPMGPSLFGISMQYFSFGLSAGGTIAVVKCDAWFDQFPLIDLIFALVTGKGRDFANRFDMRKTTALVPVAAPIPIPLFYERFGWSYKDFIGLQLQAHAGFGPTEPPPVMDWFVLLESLFKFFTEKGYYLHQHEIPESMQLPFTLEPAFVALPEYLGGAALGNQRTLPTLPVSMTLAKTLDGLKAGNIGWIIESIPLRYPNEAGGAWIRIGSESVVFGPLEFEMAWCITTSTEFQEIILQDPDAKKMLGDANADDMLTSLPSNYGGVSYDNGFIILLKGGLKITSPLADLFHLSGQFGIASLGPRDFETAIRLRGGFGPEGLLELGIEGRIKVDVPEESPTSTRVAVSGEIYLMIVQQKFALSGALEVVTGESFYAEIGLRLTNHLLITGGLRITKESTRIEGTLQLGKASYGVAAEFRKEGIIFEAITLKVGGLEASAALMLPGREGAACSLWAGLALPDSFTQDFKDSLVSTANEEVSDTINDVYAQFESYTQQIQTFETSLEGLKKWLPGMCKKIIEAINSKTTDKAIEKSMWNWAGKNVGRRIAVSAALVGGNPGKKARNSARPWINKLNAVVDASSKPIDQQYRAGLQQALTNLISKDEIKVIIPFANHKITGYRKKPVFTAKQRKDIQQGIDYIGKLPEASKKRIEFKTILDKAPREQLLAQVKTAIEEGMAAIPVVHRIGFEASSGFTTSSLLLIAEVSYNGTTRTIEIEADLSRPATLPGAVTKAVVDAFS